MAETWTEYAVRWDDETDPRARYEKCDSHDWAVRISQMHVWPSTIVGRTVTASDWLPVDNGGKS